MAVQSVMQSAALSNALGSASATNYPAIFAGFAEKGIAAQDIKPRENVFTYYAWRALGRQVRKGEHGVRITTWVAMTAKDGFTGEAGPSFRRPRGTTVFYVSQTDELEPSMRNDFTGISKVSS